MSNKQKFKNSEHYKVGDVLVLSYGAHDQYRNNGVYVVFKPFDM